MLVPAMTLPEIAAQLNREYAKIRETTVMRLAHEYDRDRRRLRINKEDMYPRTYEIKTAGKNNWIIVLSKIPAVKKYEGVGIVNCLCVAYTYGNNGLMVYYPESPRVLIGFTAHFFKRYNERLGLHLSNPIDVVKTFLTNGLYCTQKLVQSKKSSYLVAFGVDGIRFGRIKHNGRYVEWKTFVTREMADARQKAWERSLNMQRLLELPEAFDPAALMKVKSKVIALRGLSKNVG